MLFQGLHEARTCYILNNVVAYCLGSISLVDMYKAQLTCFSPPPPKQKEAFDFLVPFVSFG